MSSFGAPTAGPLALGGVRQVVADYVTLTKPKVQLLLLLTTVTTMYVAGDPSVGLVLLIALIVVSLRRRVAVPYALALTGLLVTQILVGALNVWLDEYEWLIVLHLALGTLLWTTTLGLTLQVSPARERARGRAEAVAA